MQTVQRALLADQAADTAAATRGYLSGLTLSTPGAYAGFAIAAGVAVDSAAAATMVLGSTLNKTTGAWVVGNAVGALDNGVIAANTWYHVYLMRRPDTGVVDACISLNAFSPTTSGVGIPTAYTQFRRIGSMRTDGSSLWTGFYQLGDEFLWLARVPDVAATGVVATAVLHSLSVPTGVVVNALFSARLSYNTNAGVYLLTSPDENDVAPTSDLASLTCGAAGTANAGHFNIRTNTSRQIRGRANMTISTIAITTYGWRDTRGKD